MRTGGLVAGVAMCVFAVASSDAFLFAGGLLVLILAAALPKGHKP